MDLLEARKEELQKLPPDKLDLEFKRTLAWYFSEKRWPTGFFNALPDRIEGVTNQLAELNKQLAADRGSRY